MRYFFILILLPFVSCMQVNVDGSKVSSSQKDSVAAREHEKWKYEDEFYSVYYLRQNKIELRDHRPSKNDTSILLCIPAAFTQLDDGSIDGLFMIDGKITDRKKVNHHLGGGLLVVNGKLSIIKTNDGSLLTENWKDSIAALKGSFFQQIQMVRSGAALEFHKDQKLFQRRAIVIFADSSVAMVESKNRITLQEFAEDLVKMKTVDAIYTDMGSYDEGWVRDPANGKISVIGQNRMETARQSNWVIFKRE